MIAHALLPLYRYYISYIFNSKVNIALLKIKTLALIAFDLSF